MEESQAYINLSEYNIKEKRSYNPHSIDLPFYSVPDVVLHVVPSVFMKLCLTAAILGHFIIQTTS